MNYTQQPTKHPSSAPSKVKSYYSVQPLERVLPSRHSLPSLRGRVQSLILPISSTKTSSLGSKSEEKHQRKYQQKYKFKREHLSQHQRELGITQPCSVAAIISSRGLKAYQSSIIRRKRPKSRKPPDKLPSICAQQLDLSTTDIAISIWHHAQHRILVFGREGVNAAVMSNLAISNRAMKLQASYYSIIMLRYYQAVNIGYFIRTMNSRASFRGSKA